MHFPGQQFMTATRDVGAWGPNGVYVPNLSTFTFVGALQPAKSIDLETLPEAFNRQGGVFRLYTRKLLQPVLPKGSLPAPVEGIHPSGRADRIVSQGFTLEVVSILLDGHDRFIQSGVSAVWSGAHWNPRRHYVYLVAERRPEASP
jgi:hypothetical protein